MVNCKWTDTHTHLDGEEFREDLDQTILRARVAGVGRMFLPAIDLPSCQTVLDACATHPGELWPMLGLHPEEVKADWKEVLSQIRDCLDEALASGVPVLAVGEVGLDYYWSREFEHEQLLAFEEQVRWSIETRLPLMIHCRKAQNEMVNLLRRYAADLPGGVFHCFTGNTIEASQLLGTFPNFCLGIGGVLTFKKSNLPETLRSVPLDRIVLETDSPYMAPVPHRGKRNESSYVPLIAARLAESLGVTIEEVSTRTEANVKRVFGI